jgi:hypothetical protein
VVAAEYHAGGFGVLRPEVDGEANLWIEVDSILRHGQNARDPIFVRLAHIDQQKIVTAI